MGNILFGDYPYDGNPQIQQLRPSFEALQLHRSDIAKLYDLFSKIDTDGDGTISLKELVFQMGDSCDSFRSRVFTMLDEDHSETLDFREFVLSLWNYCTLSKATLALFAFDLYDRNSNGDLSPAEIKNMLHDMYGKSYDTHFHAKGVVHDLVQQEQHMNIETFQKFVQDHPSVLFPAFQMQHALRQRILGVRFWERASQRRIELSKGRFIPVAKFIDLNVNKALYHTEIEVYGHGKGISDKAQIVLESTGTHHYRLQHHLDEMENNEFSSKKFSNKKNYTPDSSSRKPSHNESDDKVRLSNKHHHDNSHPHYSYNHRHHLNHSSRPDTVIHPLTDDATSSALISKKYQEVRHENDLHLSLEGGTKLIPVDETKSHHHYLLQLHGMFKAPHTADGNNSDDEGASLKGSSSRDNITVNSSSRSSHRAVSSDIMEIKLRKVDKASDYTQARQISRHSKYGRRRGVAPTNNRDETVVLSPIEINMQKMLMEQELKASAKANPKDIYARRITY